ncbi:MAG: response regulator, partial [Herminiimonas sp.]|nr:response regulator [Herminiimonas sp.]
SAMRADGGELLGNLSVARDVTRQKQYVQSLHEAMRWAEWANHAKTQFLANMSHEIRTPMNAVIGLSYLVGQTRLDAEQSALMAKIGLASKSLLAVINDILDLSKIEAGELLIEKNIFSLHDLLAALADVMAVQAEPKRISLDVAWSPDVPDRIEGDAIRLSQVLTNLVANAIKFTDRGGVRVQVDVAAATAQAVSLRFTVADTGIGIAPELRDCLFMPFAQADASITRRFGGTGLGLSIVKHLTRLMDGAVSVESASGIGSVFRVSLDFDLASAEIQALQPVMPVFLGQHRLQGLRILVVDDSDINRDVARRILESEGASVILAENGLQAVDCLGRRPQGVDLVLMDIQMPVLDGREATRRIRRDLSLTKLPIIALTAGALSSERQSALDAGMTDFITKPFDAVALVLRILQCTRPLALAEPALLTGPSGTPTLTWPRIAGIDASDVRKRLGDDAVLFRTLLGRLLGEFSDLEMPLPDALVQHQQRLHKLRGSAGILGATTIRQVAGEAEAACEAGAFARAAELTTGLVQALHALRSEVDRVFSVEQEEKTADVFDGSSAGPGPLEPEGALQSQELAALLDALRHQSLSALTHFEGMSGRLRHCLGQARYVSLQAHVDHLRFVEAANVLETAVARQP